MSVFRSHSDCDHADREGGCLFEKRTRFEILPGSLNSPVAFCMVDFEW